MDNFKLMYEQMTKQPFKWKQTDFVIVSKLIKDYSYDKVVEKTKILAKLCADRAVYFTEGGWADFTVGKLSAMWNQIIPEQMIDKKELESKKIENEVRARNARINGILLGK